MHNIYIYIDRYVLIFFPGYRCDSKERVVFVGGMQAGNTGKFLSQMLIECLVTVTSMKSLPFRSLLG